MSVASATSPVFRQSVGMMLRHTFAVLLAIAALQQTAALYGPSSTVVSLDPSNFRSSVKGDSLWLVEWFAPWCGHCQSLKGDWEKAAAALKGIVKVAAIDADAHKSLAQEWSIQGFPTIKLLYADKAGKIKAVDYQGARSAQAIVEWSLSQAKKVALSRIGAKASSKSAGSGGGASGGSCGGGNAGGGGGAGGGADFYSGTSVEVLTDANFSDEVLDSEELWFVEFFAPWCGHCKALKPAWTEAAQQLHGKVRVGAIDCDANGATCQQFGVRGYPTIKFFAADKRHPTDYQGDRSASGIVSYAMSEWAKNAPPPEVKELTDQERLVNDCLGHEADEEIGLENMPSKQLCFMAFLPHILDSGAAGRNAYIESLRKVADDFKDRPFSYLWAQGGSHADLEKSLEVGGFGYPALVAYSPNRNAYATLRSAFEYQHIKEFIEGVRKGYERVAKVDGQLAAVDTILPWDGKDAQPELEDEFDLADIMNEEL